MKLFEFFFGSKVPESNTSPVVTDGLSEDDLKKEIKRLHQLWMGTLESLAQEKQRNTELQVQISHLTKEVDKWMNWKRSADFRASESRRKLETATSGVTVFCTSKSSHFHRADCKWIKEIPVGTLKKLKHDEAVQLGKKPCKTCCS